MPKIKSIPLLELIFKNNGGSSDVWKAVSELLYYKEDEISVFCPYIKNKINSYDKDTSILALTLLDFCVDDGKMLLWSALSTKNFLGSLVNNLKTREETEIQNMILYLIQKWGKKFAKYQELASFKSLYTYMKNNNISFPTETNNDYSKYVQVNKKNSYKNTDTSKRDVFNKNRDKNVQAIMVETDPEDYLKDINVDLNTSSYDKIYKRLVNKLYDWTHAIHEANVLINQNINGKNNSNIEGLCKDLSKGNKQLIETIQSGKLKDSVLMEISLNVTDDINMTLSRWNNYKNGKPPGPFISSFFQNEEWRNKKLKANNNNTNNNFNNLNNFYNVNNSTININNQNNSFNNINTNNYNNSFNNNIKQNNNMDNNYNFSINQELKNYPKLYEKFKNNNNNYNNNFQSNNLQNFGQNNNINNNYQNNNNIINNNINDRNSNNQGSFNLLIDFDTAPMPSQPASNNINNNLNLNLNDKNNMDKFVDFLAMTEKLNKINQKKDDNLNNNTNNINRISNNNDFNNKNMESKNLNNDNNYEKKDSDNSNFDRKFSNDVNKSTINKSLMYPSFEELEESNTNNNNNSNKNEKYEDILDKFDF